MHADDRGAGPHELVDVALRLDDHEMKRFIPSMRPKIRQLRRSPAHRSVGWVDALWSVMDRVEKRAPWRDHEHWRDSAFGWRGSSYGP